MGMEVRSTGVWSNLQDYSVQLNLPDTLHHFIFCVDHASYRKNSSKECFNNISLQLFVYHFHLPTDSLTTEHRRGGGKLKLINVATTAINEHK